MRLVRFTQKLSGSPLRDVWVNPEAVCIVHPVDKRTLIGVQNWSFAVEEDIGEVVNRLTVPRKTGIDG